MMRALLLSTALLAASVAAAPVATADPMSDLIGMLPPGYAPDSCAGATQDNGLPAHTVVALDCTEVPGVVPAARYSLFDSVASLNHQFSVDFNGKRFTPLTCPGAPGIGPGTVTGKSGWRGKLACGILAPNDTPALMWSNESALLWARVRGPNLPGLMDWWGNVILST